MRLIATIGLLFLSMCTYSQNLIVNGDAEIEPYDPIGGGWTLVQGNWTIENNFTNFIKPHGGANHFAVPGGCPTGTTSPLSEMYQDVDVSTYASQIDAGSAQFTFTGYYASWQITDYSSVIVEYRNATSNILTSYSSGFVRKSTVSCNDLSSPANCWTAFTPDTRIAPSGTRTIRIRLISKCGGFGTSQSDNDGYYDDLSLVYVTPTPIDLLYFQAKKREDFIEINWQTASETNNNYFTLEKSIDGINWQEFAQIKSKSADNTGNYYTYTDSEISTTDVYYRLKQTDYNNEYKYFKTIKVSSSIESELTFFPNPVKDEVTFLIDEDSKIEIYTIQGSLISTIYNTNNEGPFKLNTSDLIEGNYLFKVSTENTIQTVLIKKTN